MDEIGGILEKMKESGIESALIRKDGIKIYSTMVFEDNTPEIIASFSNTVDAIIKKVKEKNNEIEISTEKGYFIVIPVGDFYLCGLTEDREKKRLLRENAKAIESVIGK